MSSSPSKRSSSARIKSNDISTKQLMDDALVDHDVSEEGVDSEEENEVKQQKSDRRMYKINSYSSLTKLDKKSRESTPHRSRHHAEGDGICKKCIASKDMPSVHYAAYAGHMPCLAQLLAKGTPTSIDKNKRTPLFYACAANQAECCGLLLQVRPEWMDIADSQLDTPVHVCCFFGWDKCLKQLLHAGANPHVRNAKGFRPSHITKTSVCLSILVSFGDDLMQGDKLGRTPLFVACTRDRVDCVEFLCAWDYQVHSWMLEQEDERSDRPLHAAACNGSIGSLQILLKYGADIYAKNIKGLTALDLAISNQHEACSDLLRTAMKEAESSATWFAPSNSRHSLNTEATTEWSECMDTDSGNVFYYNNSTGMCQWERPQEFISRQNTTQEAAHDNSTANPDDDGGDYVWVKKKKTLITVVASTQSEWCVVQDPGSKAIYYRNTKTGESQWEEPEAIQKLQHDVHAHTSQHAAELWDELNRSRDALAAKLEEERQRQANLTQAAIATYQASIQQRREEMKQKELKTLLPKSSFVKPKRKPPSLRGTQLYKGIMLNKSTGIKMSMHTIQDVLNEEDENGGSGGSGDVLAKCIDDDPILSLFVGSFVRQDTCREPVKQQTKQGHRPMQLDMTGAQRVYNCIFHYYLSLVDPINAVGMNKPQFRTLLKEALLLPNASVKGQIPPLKLHTSDMIFTQTAMEHSTISVHTSSLENSKETFMTIKGFQAAMINVADRVVAILDEKVEATIDDAGEWLCLEYVLPLVRRVAGKMAETVKRLKDNESNITEGITQLITLNRSHFQTMHKFYSSDSRFKLMTFHSLVVFTNDFKLTPQVCAIPALYHLCEAINWISGNSYTVVISFEKFVQICRTIATEFLLPTASIEERWVALLTHLNNHRHNWATTQGSSPLVLPSPFQLTTEPSCGVE
ncbi:hypothetical protein THRCLA_00911 [Thraustotheca clavata]|uniref:WW domain-containing protein n=1 Tax=Thraustotheca clavata TaxID=74557 RepID=A0A1W0A9V7_9STRA|nr:hypothetical protein THRCLA_00911 [Thraustotheca clavata]